MVAREKLLLNYNDKKYTTAIPVIRISTKVTFTKILRNFHLIFEVIQVHRLMFISVGVQLCKQIFGSKDAS